MATRIKANHSLRWSIRRIGRGLLRECLDQLTVVEPAGRDEAVHSARKSLKKLRSLVRLIRPVIRNSDYRQEESCFREAGRPLTAVRDAAIILECLDSLTAQRAASDEERQRLGRLRIQLAGRLAVAHDRLREDGVVDTIRRDLEQAVGRVKDWSRVPDRWRSIGEGLERAFQQVNEAREHASQLPSLESMHEWRKPTRYLRYQLRFVQFLDPPRLKLLADETNRINNLLGTARDHALLKQTLRESTELDGSEPFRERLLRLLDDRSEAAVGEAFRLGAIVDQVDLDERMRAFKSNWKKVR